VFDVLGKLQFQGHPLRDLLIQAVRYGERPDVRSRLTQVVSDAVDRVHLQGLIEERALAHHVMDVSRVARIREEMERADARRLQPHYIESFFLEAFKQLGGTTRQREPRGSSARYCGNTDKIWSVSKIQASIYSDTEIELIAISKLLAMPQPAR
jgi:hypothetical protein